MVIYHFLIQELFGAKRSQHFDAQQASRTLADIWLQGMLPHDGAERHRRSGSAPPSAQNKPESNNP